MTINIVDNPDELAVLKRPAVKGDVGEAAEFGKILLELAQQHENCVGLASTQVWKDLDKPTPHVFVAKISRGWITCINATSKRRGLVVHVQEGCMSKPGASVVMKRRQEIKIKYINENGNPTSEKFTGWDSIIVQHELDHLTGALII